MANGIVTIYRTYFLEDDIVDGDFPRDDVRVEVFDELSAVEAVRVFEREGLSFEGSGDVAYDVDGSRIVNYATGQRVETSAVLSGFHPRVAAAIIAKVG